MFQNLMEKAYLEAMPLFATGKSGWSLDSFFQNLIKFAQKYGGYILMFMGTAALIWSIVQAFRKYIFQSQEVRVGPVVLIAGAVFGAAFMVGGWTLAQSIGQGLSDTANEFGGQGVGLFIEQLNYLF